MNEFVAFQDGRMVRAGDFEIVAATAKSAFDQQGSPVRVFENALGRWVDIDLGGSLSDVLVRVRRMSRRPLSESGEARGRGRPKLGVVAREVTLLPRHWEWLGAQPGGASVALRKLVEFASRDQSGADRIRQVQETCYRFMLELAGDEPGYEEALRALFRRDRGEFEKQIEDWPPDVAAHLKALADLAFVES